MTGASTVGGGCERSGDRPRVSARGLAALLLVLMLPAANAPAAETLRREAVPGVWVQISTDWDMDYSGCLPDDAPEIVVSKAPSRGETLIGLALTQIPDGICKGTMVDARVLLYKANEATSGEDRFEYRVKHANGKSDDRRTVVKIQQPR